MVHQTDNQPGVLRSIDWITIVIYLALLVFGWVSVCGASYTYGDTDIFNLSSRSGMQIIWIGTSIFIGLVLLLLDDRFYDTFSYVIYAVLLLLLFATIFNPHEIKGSRSWLVLGPLRLQPAEFAKFATALAVAKLMSTYGYDIHKWKHFLAACAIVFIPMLFIVAQKETGSALVYLSFFLMFYREGMSGSILFTAVAMVFYFVAGIKFEDVLLWEGHTSAGKFVVLLAVQIFTSVMIYSSTGNLQQMKTALYYCLGGTVLALLFSTFVIPFDVVWVQLVLCGLLIGYVLFLWLSSRMLTYGYILAFAIGSIAFFYSADYVLDNVLQEHQRKRIEVLLGLKEDLAGAGYNVHQSEIAIGSGGLLGKGFLNGEGFLGSATVLLLFLALILRLIKLAERQPFRFGRVYGYCVLSIFLFHMFINVGMVLGLTPVIGIPLPFFSYGGSSLWGFTFLLFIFLRIDAGRNLIRE